MTKISCIVIFLIVVLLVIGMILFAVYSIYPQKYNSIVQEYSRQFDIEKSLIFAIIKVESNFVQHAQSQAGAKGLMQIMDNTAKWISEGDENLDLFDADDNICIGVRYLHYLMKKYDSHLITVLAAYNAGEGNVDRWIRANTGHNDEISTKRSNILMIEDIGYPETYVYVEKVLKIKNYYEILYKLE